ncbi:hypothetical protein PY650_09170 [Rhizobium calliandrae]|uniref:Uncharacterized protein n=1 Tax=Rhizobium calliandrae TaxID=1312182 RepID=A0ABT7KB84_9HYPH|nr:hypothetical protein [Rhizobium calliandrae]MDL2405832.1 hypothetical protein [Rhizobium calliandrae]
MSTHTSVLIVGGGLNGLTAAALLAHLRVQLRAPYRQFRGRNGEDDPRCGIVDRPCARGASGRFMRTEIQKCVDKYWKK